MSIFTNHLDLYIKDSNYHNFTIEDIGFQSPYDTTEMHRHSFYQIIILEQGSALHIVDFEKYEMQSPCVSVVFPQQVHKLELSNDAKGYIIMFDETIFCSEILANELKEYNVDLHRKINFVGLGGDASEMNNILEVVRQIKMLQGSLNEIRKMQIKFLTKIIILKIIDSASGNELSMVKNRNLDIYIHFRELVDKEFAKSRKVEHYCDILGISAKKLNSICRECGGKTSLVIIHERLTLEIKKIFMFEDISLKEIAFQLNFDSQSALNKYIFSKFECTPSQLKELVVNNYQSKK